MKPVWLDTDAVQEQTTDHPDAFGRQLFTTRSQRFQIILSYTACLIGVSRAPMQDQVVYAIWIGPLTLVWYL